MNRQFCEVNRTQLRLAIVFAALFCFAQAAQSLEKKGSAQQSPPEVTDSHLRKLVGSGPKKPGWMFETTVKDLGLSRCYVTADGFRAEYPMFIVYATNKDSTVTVGSWETQKCFSFPMEKSKYYLGLMGFSIGKHTSAFERDYKQSPWKKIRDLKVQELPAAEYERFVLNPPPGRTRTQHQIVTHISLLPRKFYGFYDEFVSTEPAQKDAILLENSVQITNPAQSWKEFSTNVAKKVMVATDDMTFPKGFHKVSTVSEVLLNDSRQALPLVKQPDLKLKEQPISRPK